MAKQIQMTFDLFQDFINKEKDSFVSIVKGLNNSVKLLRASIPNRITAENVEIKKTTSMNLLKKIKDEGDILGILPSTTTLIKYFDGLDRLEQASNLNLEDDEESKFLQRFYKFFIKSRNQISKENKELLLDNGEIIQEVYNLEKSISNLLSDNDFKSIVQIYKMKIEHQSENALQLAKSYKSSPIFQRNIINIILIHNIAFDNGFDFDFVNSNILNLLLVSYLKKSGISANSVKENILFALETLQNNKPLDFEILFAKTKNSKSQLISRKNNSINLKYWLLIQIAIGSSKTNKLTFAKSIFDLDISKYQMNIILGLKVPSIKNENSFRNLLLQLDKSFDDILTKVII